MICAREPRRRLVHLPTPLEPAPRLSAALGVELLIKREDLAGLVVGGNKARLLEFALGALAGEGVDTLIAHAAAQSNKLRDIAAVAARAGMRAILLIPEAAPLTGNRLLFDLLGAEVRVSAAAGREAILAAEHRVAGEVRAAGGHPAVLDRALGYGVDATIAYVNAAEELHGQFAALPSPPRAVFIAAGAGMTAAGLALGLKHLGSPARVFAVAIASRAAELAPEIERHAARAAERLAIATRLGPSDYTLLDRHPEIGYGALPPVLVAVIRRFARLHGMVIDPVYNAKVALALVEEAEAGRIPRGGPVVYVNTGGGPALFEAGERLAGEGGA